MAFPSSPTNLQSYTANGITWVYYSNIGAWEKQSSGSTQIPILVNSNLTVTGGILASTLFSSNSTTVGTTLTGIGQVLISNTDSSTSTTTGALLVSGGVGVIENINVGGNLNVSGITNYFSGNIGINQSSPRGRLDVTSISGQDSIVFGTGTTSYPTTPSSTQSSIVSKGSTSDGRLMVQDGNGRLNDYWNAYTDSGGYKYIVSGEPAARQLMSINSTTGANFGWYSAPAGTAGSSLSWTQIGSMIGGTGGGTWFSPRGTSSDLYLDTNGNVGIGTTAPTSSLHVTDGTSSTQLFPGYLVLSNPNDITPTTNPPTGALQLFARNRGGREMPAFQGPSGLDSVLQPILGANRVYYWAPVGLNTTTAPGQSLSATVLTTVGTATARPFATTNVLTRVTRVAYASAATAGTLASARVATAWLTTGDGAGLGGFTAIFRFGVSDAATRAAARMFVGLSSTTGAATNVEPSTLTNSVGVAQLSTDATQWYIVYGGSAAQSAIPLGTSLGAPTLTNTLWDFTLFSPPSSNGVVGYEMKNVGSGVSVQGLITPGTPGTQTPASTTALTLQMWRTNNTTAAAVIFDFCSVYIETDN